MRVITRYSHTTLTTPTSQRRSARPVIERPNRARTHLSSLIRSTVPGDVSSSDTYVASVCPFDLNSLLATHVVRDLSHARGPNTSMNSATPPSSAPPVDGTAVPHEIAGRSPWTRRVASSTLGNGLIEYCNAVLRYVALAPCGLRQTRVRSALGREEGSRILIRFIRNHFGA